MNKLVSMQNLPWWEPYHSRQISGVEWCYLYKKEVCNVQILEQRIKQFPLCYKLVQEFLSEHVHELWLNSCPVVHAYIIPVEIPLKFKISISSDMVGLDLHLSIAHECVHGIYLAKSPWEEGMDSVREGMEKIIENQANSFIDKYENFYKEILQPNQIIDEDYI